MSLLELNDTDFDKYLAESELPVVVDFWADWCGPCRKVSPIMEKIAEDLTGKVNVVKVNIDEAVDTGLKQKIMSLPTINVYQGGRQVVGISGAHSRDVIQKVIESQL